MKLKNNLFLVLILFLGIACQSQKENTKPNVIIVMADDQGYGDLACNGNPIIKTPNIDQFSTESVRLTNFHSGTTCTPTRGGLMTGRNSNRNCTWHTIGGCSILNEKETTIAQIFRENGYSTGMVGKWHLGDNYPFRPHDRGFQSAFYNGGGGVGQTPDYWGNDYFDDTYFRNGVPEKTEGYCTDVWFNEAKRFVNEHANEPFFLYLSLNAPHGPFNVPEKYYEMYKNADLMPVQKRFYGMITELDEQFGEFRELLKKKGLDKNTILIFLTDNGTAAGYWYDKKNKKFSGFNAGMRGTKGSHYDGGHRVPFFISWPEGIKEVDRDVNQLTAHVDLVPSLVDLVGLKHQFKNELDGTSIKDLLLNKKSKTDFENRMLVVDTQRNQWPEKGRNSCVMSTRWRLIDGNQLYDIANDPGQRTNLAETYPNVVKEMNAFYDEWWAEIDKEFEYSRIAIGSEQANPVRLTCHDMHSEQNIPWNQNMIRKGISFTKGNFLTKVEKAGKYKFSISRYPQESKLTIDAKIEGRAATSHTEEIAKGEALILTEPFLVVGGKTYPMSFSDDHTCATCEIDLEEGDMEFYGGFVNANKEKTIAYYYTVEKL